MTRFRTDKNNRCFIMVNKKKEESKMMNTKGQGALEYLLLIGGAVLVAVIVITLLLGITSEGQSSTELSTATTLCKNNAVTANPQTPSCTGIINIGTNAYNCCGNYPSCIAQTAACS